MLSEKYHIDKMTVIIKWSKMIVYLPYRPRDVVTSEYKQSPNTFQVLYHVLTHRQQPEKPLLVGSRR